MDRSQGSRVKVAIHALKAINDFIAIYKNTECSKKQWDSFYSNYIVVNAPYKDGANAIFGKQKIINLNTVWKSILDKEALLQSVYSNLNLAKIANFFGDLFDFPYETHKDDQLLADTFFKVIAKHIAVMFRAFPELQLFDIEIRNNIIDSFISKNVLKKQGWSNFEMLHEETMVPMDITLLKNEISKLIDFEKHRLFSTEERTFQDEESPGVNLTSSFNMKT